MSRQKSRRRKPREDDTYYHDNPERVYAAEWLKKMRAEPHFLEQMLSLDVKGGVRISQREAELIAGVIQWLGTNCGQGFLFTTERKIAEAADKAQVIREKRFRQSLNEVRLRQAEERAEKQRAALAKQPPRLGPPRRYSDDL